MRRSTTAAARAARTTSVTSRTDAVVVNTARAAIARVVMEAVIAMVEAAMDSKVMAIKLARPVCR